MPISTLSTPPQTSDPSNFDARADVLLGAELPRLVTEINAAGVVMTAQEASATAGATAAAAAAALAVGLQTAAIAAAGYRGEWPSLAGAAALADVVSHNGFFWVANAAIASIPAAEPGVSTSWTQIIAPGGTSPDQQPRGRDLGTAAYLNQTWVAANATFDPGSVSNGAQTTTTVAVPGAVLGDFVMAVSLSIDAAGMQVSGYISAANVATVVYQNTSGGSIDLASHTVYVRVMKRLSE